VVAVLAARLGEVPLAGHQIASALASATFMCVVGLSFATATRVGYHIGAGCTIWARRVGFANIAVGGAMMGLGGVVMLLYCEPIALMFAPGDAEVARTGALVLRVVAIFSVADGVQVVAVGALRGAGDTRWPFYATAIAYWLVGLPILLFLGLHLDMGVVGFWWGLTVGLTGLAVTLTARFHVLSGRQIERLEAVPDRGAD
jgi:MATE family multidrug resistance protein